MAAPTDPVDGPEDLDRPPQERPTPEQEAAAIAAQMEMIAFARTFSARRPWVSWVFAATAGLVFLAQSGLGLGGLDMPAMVRLGAIRPEGVSLLTPLSSAFLHGGVLHIFMNLSVLLGLGAMLERLVGPRRTLLLYAISAFAGGMVAQLASDKAVVGASTVLWGVFAAAAFVSWRRPELFPGDSAAGFRRSMVQTLVINLLISLMPGVSLAGHLGGALGGLLVAASGLLGAGVVRPANGGAPIDHGGPGWSGAAALSALALWGSLGYAQLDGQPWRLLGPVETAEVQVPGTAISLDLPVVQAGEGATAARATLEERHLVAGDLFSDPMMVELSVLPDAITGGALADPHGELGQVLREQVTALLPDFRLGEVLPADGPDGSPGVMAIARLPAEGTVPVRVDVRALGPDLVMCMILRYGELPEVWQGAANRMLDSLRRDAPTPSP